MKCDGTNVLSNPLYYLNNYVDRSSLFCMPFLDADWLKEYVRSDVYNRTFCVTHGNKVQARLLS